MAKLLVFSMVFISILIFIIFILLIVTSNTAAAQKCTDTHKIYATKQANCVVNFRCRSDYVTFRDSCGCGCLLKTA